MNINKRLEEINKKPKNEIGLKRIMKEYFDLNKNPIVNCGITVGLFDKNDIRKWKVTIFGPKDTSYRGGLFFFSVIFPEEYPFKAPGICFMTPIYHVNVNHKAPRNPNSYPLGYVDISTLNLWTPFYTMREVLTNLFALFYLGNSESPFALERADEFRNNREVYEEKIKYFTEKYANPIRSAGPWNPNIDWDFSYKINYF